MSLSVSRNPNLSVPAYETKIPNSVLAEFGEKWWTGVHPEICPGFDQTSNSLKALPLLNFNVCTRKDILNYFDNNWTLTEVLFSGLKNESAYTRPPYHQLRHPLMFYYGHTAAVFINKLRLAGLVTAPLNPYLEKILEIGVDEMSWDDMAKNEMAWPPLKEVHAYRKEVYSLIKNLILTHPDLENFEKFNSSFMTSPAWAIFMGFEHEKIHFETSSVLIRELPIEIVETPKYWTPMHPSYKNTKDLKPQKVTTSAWLTFEGGKSQIGKKSTEPSFGWDNEYGFREVKLTSFQVSQGLISNSEYYEFVSTNAYTQDKYWLPEGLHWRKFRNTRRPTFWMSHGPEGLHEYKLRTIFEIIPMPWTWPAEVNYHEAQAFCQWKKEKEKSPLHYRLITEGEHKFLSEKQMKADAVLQSKPNIHLEPTEYNFNFKWSSPSPVDENSQPKIVHDLYGNVWQWTEDQFNPLENFSTHRYYEDFSTPCFDGKHQMILGGSFISCGHEASRWARFHFRPHFYQHSGFRIASTLDGSHDNGSFKFNRTTDYTHKTREHVLDQMQKENWWKKIDQPLELESEEIKKILQSTQQQILKQQENFKSFPPGGTAYDPQTALLKKNFSVNYQSTKNFPHLPESYDKLLDFIFTELDPQSQHPGHPGFAAYVAGAGNMISNSAQLVAQTLNPFSGHYRMAPGLVTLEAEVIQWFISMLGLGENAQGFLTTGGSFANLSALSLARKKYLTNVDPRKGVVYMSSQSHHCFGKAMAFLGFGKENLQIIDVDSKSFKINLGLLKDTITVDRANGKIPFCIIGNAGTTNTGAVDDLSALAGIAQTEKIWFHVDGAYGASFMLTEQGQKILKGISEADSVCLDPHKGLSIPYGTGCLLVKDRKNLYYDFAGSKSYMPPELKEDEYSLAVDFSDITTELSRDYRGLRLWLPIKTLGIGPFQLNLEEKLALTKELFKELSTIPEIEVLTKPELSILVFAVKTSKDISKDNTQTEKLLQAINQKENIFLSGCELHGRKAIRVCLLGFRLHYEQIQILLKDLRHSILEIGN